MKGRARANGPQQGGAGHAKHAIQMLFVLVVHLHWVEGDAMQAYQLGKVVLGNSASLSNACQKERQGIPLPGNQNQHQSRLPALGISPLSHS